MSKRTKSIAIGAVLLSCATAVGALLLTTSFGRSIRGISSIAVENRSGVVLSCVKIRALDSAGALREAESRDVSPADSVTLRVRTSDLIVDDVWIEAGGREHSLRSGDGANVTPGETARYVVDERFAIAFEGQRRE